MSCCWLHIWLKYILPNDRVVEQYMLAECDDIYILAHCTWVNLQLDFRWLREWWTSLLQYQLLTSCTLSLILFVSLLFCWVRTCLQSKHCIKEVLVKIVLLMLLVGACASAQGEGLSVVAMTAWVCHAVCSPVARKIMFKTIQYPCSESRIAFWWWHELSWVVIFRLHDL